MTTLRANPANDPAFLLSLEERMHRSRDTLSAVHELFHRGQLRFMLHDGQRRIQENIDSSESKEFLVFCSRQFGKSFFGLVYALQFLQQNPRTKAYIFAGTNKDAMDIANDNLAVIQRLAPPGWLTRYKTERRWIFENDSQLRIGSLEEPDATRGRNCNLIIIEEGAAACSSDQFQYAVSSVIGPMLLRSKNWRMIHITTPSKDVNHIIHRELIPKLSAKGAIARFTIHDNPQLTPSQIAEARERCLTEEDWDREYMVKVVRYTSLTVVPEFDEGEHIVTETRIPEKAHWTIGLDIGGVRDKHGLCLGYYHFEEDTEVITDEILLPVNTSLEDIADAVRVLKAKVPKGHTCVVAADAPGQVRIDLSNLGIATFFPEKKKGSFEAGINFVRKKFKTGTLKVHERCKNLRNALLYGQFNKQRTDFARNEELGHCDMIAALVYKSRMQRTDNPYPDRFKLNKDTHFFESERSRDDLERMLLG